jgi:O-antigen ligase
MRLFALIAFTAAVPALIFSYARGAIVALALGLLVWLGVMRPRWALGLAAVFAAVAVLFAPATLKERFSPQASSGQVPLRTDVWGAAVDIAQNHPWLGAGLGNFSDAYKQLPSTLSHASQRRLLNQSGLLVPPHAQNLYLNVLAEEGVFGIAALTIFAFGAVAVVYRGSRAREPTGRAICLGAGAGVLTVAFHSVLEVTLFTELSLPLFALLGAALVVRALDTQPEPAIT